jgi:hypothetical protein
MYASYSALNSPDAVAAQGSGAIALYADLLDQLDAPNRVIIPSPWVGSASLSGSWLEHWLYEAFAAYVIDGADLAQALAEAQRKADAYLGCVRDLPVRDPAQEYAARYQQMRACAVQVDPSLE